MADLVLWDPSYFGPKPRAIYKSGYCVWAMSGDGAACLNEVEPVIAKPQWGAYGSAPQSCCANFIHPSAIEADVAGRENLGKAMLPLAGTRTLSKADMLHNDALPNIRVNPQSFEVFADGELATCEPASKVVLGQKYFLR